MAKILSVTALLLLITVTSKLIGFVRELALLEAIGINHDLDLFLILYAVSGLIMSIFGVSIMTNLTPVAHLRSGPDQTLEILVEAVKVGASLTVFAWVVSWVYIYIVAPQTGAPETLVALCAIIPMVVFFAIISEYQVAILLSRNNQLAVVSGNMIISLPLIVLLLLTDIGIVTYAAGLVASFALRTVIFTIWIYRQPTPRFSWRAAFTQPTILRKNFRSIAAGGSAMISVNTLFLVCLLVSQQFGEGQASYFGYGLKIPMLVLTSVWFVFGSQFFSQIVATKGANARAKIVKLTKLNCLLTLGMATGVFATIMLSDQIARIPFLGGSNFVKILQASLPFLPLIIVVPIIEMAQRTLVTLSRPYEVFPIAIAVVLSGSIGLLIAWWLASPLASVLAMSIALCIGALVAVLRLRNPIAASVNFT